MAAWIWVLIPLTAILMGGFKEWLAFKAKQDKLGTSTHELEAAVEQLQAALDASEEERAAMARRLQNLETIVTSVEWDALEADSLQVPRQAEPAGPARRTPPELELPPAPEEDAPAERARKMARRLTR